MQIKILGCSGGIGAGMRTTSLLVDHDILIDAGTGVGDLPMDALLAIDHIFITHSHMDHIAFIPFLLDNALGVRKHPVTVHAKKETILALKTHIFNWIIWPDFSVIPSLSDPILCFNEISVGQPVRFGDRTLTPLPANHVVPAVGYQVDSGAHSFVFTGDTTECEALWRAVNNIQNLKYLVIETAFSNSELALAKQSKHLCPSMLASELAKLNMDRWPTPVEVYISHLKPGEGDMIMQEIAAIPWRYPIAALQHQQMFNF